MKKTLAILGLIAFSNAANSNFAQMPGKITPIIKADSDNELHNYVPMASNKGNVQVNDYYKSHDDADNELHNYIPIAKNQGDFQMNEYKTHDDADNELHNYIPMASNKGNVQVNDYYKSHDDADNEFYDDNSINQIAPKRVSRYIAHLIPFNPQEKNKDFLALE